MAAMIWFAAIGLLSVYAAGLVLWLQSQPTETPVQRQRIETAALWLLFAWHAGLTLLAAGQGTWNMPLSEAHSRLFGWVIMALGGIVFTAGVVSSSSWRQVLGSDCGTIQTWGVYRFSRNPRLLGWALYLLGAAFVNRSGLALLLVIGLWAWILGYLRVHERRLAAREGARWRTYRQHVARFFGRPSLTIQKSR